MTLAQTGAQRLDVCCGASRGVYHPRLSSTYSNKIDSGALTTMPKKDLPSDKPGPMGMQPVEHGPLSPTQMLPLMPGTKGEKTRPPAPEKKQRTRAEAVRAVLARITRRNSLRKQRDAQKS
jgi:hypothetical protein